MPINIPRMSFRGEGDGSADIQRGFSMGQQFQNSQRLKDLQEREDAVRQFQTLREILTDPDPQRRDILFDYWGTSKLGKDAKPQIDVFRKLLKDADEQQIQFLEKHLGDLTGGISDGSVNVRDAYQAFRDPLKTYQFLRGRAVEGQTRDLLTAPPPAGPQMFGQDEPAMSPVAPPSIERAPMGRDEAVAALDQRKADLLGKAQKIASITGGGLSEQAKRYFDLQIQEIDKQRELLKPKPPGSNVELAYRAEQGDATAAGALDRLTRQIPQTDVGKLVADRKALVEQGLDESSPAIQAIDAKIKRFDIGEAHTPIAKLQEDVARAEKIYGADSRQAKALRDALQAEMSGGTPKLTEVRGIRQEFVKGAGDFVTVRDAYDNIKSAAASKNATGDVALLYALIKIFDPGSVVREGEIALAKQTAGVPDQILNMYNKLVQGGGSLTPHQRDNFVEQGSNIFKNKLNRHMSLERQYEGIAKRNNIDPSDVIVDYVGEYRQSFKGRSATRAEVDAAKQEAGGDAAKARSILQKKGIDPSRPVVE